MGGIALHGNFRVDAQDWGMLHLHKHREAKFFRDFQRPWPGFRFRDPRKRACHGFLTFSESPKAFGTAPFRTAPCACG
jgi:hypothetical protein